MIRLILWLSILIQMIDNSALASELNHTPWYRNNWLYLIGLLIILIFVITFVVNMLFDIHFAVTKGRTDLKRSFSAQKRRVAFSFNPRTTASRSG